MTILALETSTTICGVAVLRHDILLAEQWIEERSAHAERLFGLIDAAMDEAGIGRRACDALAVSIGPGSFTGLRIGLSAAKGLHLALGVPVIAVPTLTALAERCVPMFAGSPGHCIAALDARRDEAYCQSFSVREGVMTPLGTPEARSVAEIVRSMPRGPVVLTGDAREKIAGALTGTGAEVRCADATLARCSAGAVARVGAAMLARGEVADPGTLEPMYVKEVFLRTAQ